MKIAKIYMNSESEELAVKNGLFIFAEIINSSVEEKPKQKYYKYKTDRKQLSNRIVYEVRPIEDDIEKPDKILELRNCILIKKIEEKHIKTRNYNKIISFN